MMNRRERLLTLVLLTLLRPLRTTRANQSMKDNLIHAILFMAVLMAMVLAAVGLPLEGIGLLLAVDRPLDMCRTATNVTGDGVGALVLNRWAQCRDGGQAGSAGSNCARR